MNRSTRLTKSTCSVSILTWTLLPAFLVGLASHRLMAEEGLGAEAVPGFRSGVMAVLSKAGCNMGTCHGNQNGKGGFRLSLRGENPEFDFHQITRGDAARRIDLLAPEESLLLLKPTGAVAHQGGVRLEKGDLGYQILRRWIESGARLADSSPGHAELLRIDVLPSKSRLEAKDRQVRLRVMAHWAAGTTEDVTELAVFEATDPHVAIGPTGEVTFAQPGEVHVNVRFLNQQTAISLIRPFPYRPSPADAARRNKIDQEIDAKLARLSIPASPDCTDAEYLRRIYLDLLGRLPAPHELDAAMRDTSPNRRARWADQVLSDPDFGSYWALKWSDLLRNEEKTLDVRGVEVFYQWMRDALNRDLPYDQFVRELVSGVGSTYQHPPANYYRANRDPATRGETTARLFLGIRLQCARCHNHPFDRWSQDDYYDWAAVFAGIDYEIVDNKRRDKFDKHEFVGEQVVKVSPEAKFNNARTGKPAQPRFLGQADSLESPSNRLNQLAAWLTSPANDPFVRSQVNLVWYHLMGRGLVDPVDDLRLTNPASHPELLQSLADQFVEDGFQLKALIRTLVGSAAYQRSSLPLPHNQHDTANYARTVPRRLPAEVLLDAQAQVLGVPIDFAGYESGRRATHIPGVRKQGRYASPKPGDRFLSLFGKPARLLACECERSNETNLGQAFALIGSQDLQARLAHPDSRILQWSQDDQQGIEQLYRTALTRSPTDDEKVALLEWLERTRQAYEQQGRSADDSRHIAWQDLVWAVLNSKEFLFRF